MIDFPEVKERPYMRRRQDRRGYEVAFWSLLSLVIAVAIACVPLFHMGAFDKPLLALFEMRLRAKLEQSDDDIFNIFQQGENGLRNH